MTAYLKNAFGLDGSICAVTGAAGGIGRAVAVAMAREGAAVVVLDRNAAGAEETLDLVCAEGGEGLAFGCDVSDQGAVEAVAAEVRGRLGPVGVLVNNAAIIRPGKLSEVAISDWNALLSVNLTGYLICAQAFGRSMLDAGAGAVVHISSCAATIVTPNAGAYSPGKAAVTMLSGQLAVEWGPLGVRSNAVHPGLIETPLSKPVYDRPGTREARSQAIPLRRIGQPEDVAEAALFLASPRAAYVNGAVLAVDGGFPLNIMNLVPRIAD